MDDHLGRHVMDWRNFLYLSQNSKQEGKFSSKRKPSTVLDEAIFEESQWN